MSTEGFADDGTMLKDFMQLDLAHEMLTSEQTKPWQTGHCQNAVQEGRLQSGPDLDGERLHFEGASR